MQNVLVTGGAGFIGSNFVRYILQHEPGIRIINLDALTYAGRLENLTGLPSADHHIFVHGDICDHALVDDLLHRYAIDTIVHFAAETHVDRSIVGPEKFIQSNIVGTFTMLEAARQAWLVDKVLPLAKVRFHHISTDEVFGALGPGDPPFNEATTYAPNSPYAASKAASDHLVRAYYTTYGLPFTITNCSNNYGPYQFPEKLIPLVVLNGRDVKELPVYGDGMQVRDWLYVEDHCEAVHRVIQRGRVGETYLVGGNNQQSNIEIVKAICQILDEIQSRADQLPHASLIKYVGDRPGHDRRYAMDSSKIQRELGWRPRHSLKTGLEETVRWYLEHPAWVEAIQHQAGFQKWMEANYAHRGGSQ